MKKICAAGCALLLAITLSANAYAQPHLANTHAPIGVMGDHTHEAGEWMFSYRYMHMGMEGNRIGTAGASADAIVTSVPNRFFGMPMQPPTLRVVPTSMTMDMHMLGVMYAPRDWLTLMAMGMHVTKEMKHVTFMGPAGTLPLGNFTTESSGFGDSTLMGLLRVHSDQGRRMHLNLGLTLPTGSNTRAGTVLTPMGGAPVLRLPYAMQSGGGTYNFKPGATYTSVNGSFSWGAQYLAELALGKNAQGYALGNVHMLSAWVGYAPASWISGSLRLAGETRKNIRGIDPAIVAPVQTADPANYGGERLDIVFGINLIGQEGALGGHRLGFEIEVPLHQDLNGPQMERDWALTMGWQKSF